MVRRLNEASCLVIAFVFFFMLQVNARLTQLIEQENMWKQDEAFISFCASQTQKDLSDSDSDTQQKLQIVCQAKQKFSDCIACCREGGPLLEIFRYYRWQENEADVKLSICPFLRFDKLKLLMQNSDIAKKLNHKDNVEKDDQSPCGTAIFMQCINAVPQPMKNVIEAMYSFLGCVEDESDTCSATLIQHFANLAKSIRFLLQVERKALGRKKREKQKRNGHHFISTA